MGNGAVVDHSRPCRGDQQFTGSPVALAAGNVTAMLAVRGLFRRGHHADRRPDRRRIVRHRRISLPDADKVWRRGVDRATLLNAHVVVETSDGRAIRGSGSMPLGNVWAFPSKQLSYTDTLGALMALAKRIAGITLDCPESGHPIDLNHSLEAAYFQTADEVTIEQGLPEPIPQSGNPRGCDAL